MDYGALFSAAAGGGVTWAGQVLVAALRSRALRSQTVISEAAKVDQHRDRLTFDLLQAAREEVQAAREEAAEMRSLQMRLIHFDEALEHIDALLHACAPDERETAERRARLFLVRIKRTIAP